MTASYDELAQAEAAAKELGAERPNDAARASEYTLRAHQGHALRQVLYHGFAALVEAIREGRQEP